jgi:hypothetical protein
MDMPKKESYLIPLDILKEYLKKAFPKEGRK